MGQHEVKLLASKVGLCMCHVTICHKLCHKQDFDWRIKRFFVNFYKNLFKELKIKKTFFSEI